MGKLPADEAEGTMAGDWVRIQGLWVWPGPGITPRVPTIPSPLATEAAPVKLPQTFVTKSLPTLALCTQLSRGPESPKSQTSSLTQSIRNTQHLKVLGTLMPWDWL